MKNCVFCDREKIASAIVFETNEVLIFEPLNPVVDGHLLVVPKKHVQDFTECPVTFAKVAQVASEYAGVRGDYNLITSKGKSATQSVFHLHIHLVPRKEGDGLLLPWSNQQKS